MNHECAMIFAVFSNIGEVEAVWHAEVVLNGNGSIFLAVCILHLHVYLWSIKCSFVLCFFKLASASFHKLAQKFFAFFPCGIVFIILFCISTVAEREAIAVILSEL